MIAGRLTAIWAILIVATLAGFGTAGLRTAGGAAFVIVMLVAAFKARLVVRHYMGLRSAPFAWRIAFDGLIGAMAAIIVGLHVLA